MEVKYQIAHGLETMPPEKDQEEQGQVDELLAQGSSALSLSPCDAPLHMITLEKSLCVDRFVIDDLCKKWSHELESLNAKSIFASYVDPFLINPSIDRHEISLVKSTLNVGVTSFYAKMPKLSFVGNFELHCAYDFDHFLKLLKQVSEIHCDELCLLNDNPSCKLDVCCDEPPLYFDQEFVNLWKRTSYLSKSGVLMIENDCSLHERENKIFVLRPLLITFHFAPYEDPFLYMPSLDENAKSFVKMFNNLGIICMGMIEPNRNKVLGACVFWHVDCFYCMSIKPFNGVGMFYGLFVKNFISNGFVWDYIVKECLCLFAPTSCTYIVRLFEFWYEGYLDEFVLIPYGWDLDMKGFINLCSHIYCDLALSLREHEFGGPYNVFGVVLSLRAVSGLNPFHHTLIFDLLFFHFIGVRNPDLRANPFQEWENDMTMSARHQVSSPRREPWIDWGPRKRVKTCQGFNKARGSPEDARNREGLYLRTNPFQEGEDDTIMEAVRQGFQLQLDSTRNRPIEMISESYETITIVFVLETTSLGYLAHLNRNPNEGVMAILQKSCRTGEGVQREHSGGCFAPCNSPDRVNHPRLSF
ncbi:uncharacterized protein LOC125212775 isoform X1 [Salvia hispanica]|uniref:uncharacterized protein LOC125212775 isoform X1 n=1 Tax=Salvia hispanica TaxID=49212 RepID=UPI0020090E48|nr:uncharacterized protein LOC125212775 isoform X1 [Salvia hispanica]